MDVFLGRPLRAGCESESVSDGLSTFQASTHVSFGNLNSVWYDTKGETAKYSHSPIRLQLSRIKSCYLNE
jgi:hypothetical protein